MSTATSYATTIAKGAQSGFTLFGLFDRSTKMTTQEDRSNNTVSRTTSNSLRSRRSKMTTTGGRRVRKKFSPLAFCSFVTGGVCFLTAAALTLGAGFGLSWLVWSFNADASWAKDPVIVTNRGQIDGFDMLILRLNAEITSSSPPTLKSVTVSSSRRNFVNVSIYSPINDTIYQAHIKLISQYFAINDKLLTGMENPIDNRQPIHLCFKRIDYKILVYYNYFYVGHFTSRRNINAKSYEILTDRPSTYKIFSQEQANLTKTGIISLEHPTTVKSAEIIFHLNSRAKFNLIFKSESFNVIADLICNPIEEECLIGHTSKTQSKSSMERIDRIELIRFDSAIIYERDLCVFRLLEKTGNNYKITVNGIEFDNYLLPKYYEPIRRVYFRHFDQKSITVYRIDIE